MLICFKLDPLSKEGAVFSKFLGEIVFKDVIFAYPSRPDKLVYGGDKCPTGFNLKVRIVAVDELFDCDCDITLLTYLYICKVQAGKTVAIVGPSGGFLFLLLTMFSHRKCTLPYLLP